MDNQTANQNPPAVSVSTSGPSVTQVQWPQKPKNQTRRILFAFLAIILVAGIAGAAYYVSNQLSTRQAVAPTAPTGSQAACKNDSGCKKTETCKSGVCKKIAPTPTGYGTGYTCTSTNCPGPCFGCNAGKTSCLAKPSAPGCGGVSTGVGGDKNNCGGTGNVCPGSSSCVNGQCILNGTVVTPTPYQSPTPAPTTTQTIPPQAGNNCNGACATIDCHCQNGDVCTAGQGICNELIPGTNTTLRAACTQQGRSWCVNQYNTGMTCCAVGYTCNGTKPGCVGSIITTPKVTKTGTPPPTKTGTPTPPPMACTAIALFTPQETETTCTTDAECASAAFPEGRFCDSTTGRCNSWFPTTVSQLSTKAKIGTPIKASFTATNVSKVDAKVNSGAYLPTKKNPATGKYDFIFTIPSAGTFTIQAKYSGI